MEDKLERLTKFVANLSDRLEVMEEGKEETLGLLDSLKYSFKEELTEHYSVEETHTTENARFKEEMTKFKEGMIKHQEGLQVCMAAIAGGTIAREATPRTKAPEPMKYGGKRDPKELEAFFWAMECYLKHMKIKKDEAMIDTAVLYLSDDAALWWRRKHGDIEKGVCTLDTWSEFKSQLKRQFCPRNVEEIAMKKLRGLKQTGNIKEYVSEFTHLMFDLPELDEKSRLFYFLDGLQHWAHAELKRRDVQTVYDAIAAAEELIEETKDVGTRRFGGGDRPQRPMRADPRPDPRRVEFQRGDRPAFGGRTNGGFVRREMKCFMCDGPHMMRDCPTKKKRNALLLEEDERETQVSSIRLLNALKAKEEEKAKGGGLMFVHAEVNGIGTKTLLDTGASHNFIAEGEAVKVGITYTREMGWMKAVNSTSQPILGVARDVPIHLGGWEGTVDLTVVPMDDYSMLLGMEFMDQARPLSFEKDLTMQFTKGSTTHIVPLERGKMGSRMLSAMQFSKGLKR